MRHITAAGVDDFLAQLEGELNCAVHDHSAAASQNELKVSPPDRPCTGKRKLPLAVYRNQCMERIAKLDGQMAKYAKSSHQWQRLRK